MDLFNLGSNGEVSVCGTASLSSLASSGLSWLNFYTCDISRFLEILLGFSDATLEFLFDYDYGGIFQGLFQKKFKDVLWE